jgi:hypothetical protein
VGASSSSASLHERSLARTHPGGRVNRASRCAALLGWAWREGRRRTRRACRRTMACVRAARRLCVGIMRHAAESRTRTLTSVRARTRTGTGARGSRTSRTC